MEAEEVVHITLYLPKSLHTELKVYSAQASKPMSTVATGVLVDFFGIQNKPTFNPEVGK